MEIIPDKKKLVSLIEKSKSGEIVLPQFQRYFVWSRDDISDLLLSITKNYFIGTFLLLRVDRDNLPFAPRPIRGADLSETDLKPTWMILDGQQRITSLYYVFNAPDLPLRWTKYPYRFFLNFNEINKDNIDEAIFSERADYCSELINPQYQFENLIIPFTMIPKWNIWRRQYEEYLIKKDKDFYFEKYFPIFLKKWEKIIDNVLDYSVSTIEMGKINPENQEEIAEVCTIFEKMNSTGVDLSVFDLLTARLHIHKINLHKLWEDYLNRSQFIKEFSNENPDPYGIFILRTIALIRGLEVKSKTLINLSPNSFIKDWKSATKYFDKTLQRITSTNPDGFGVYNKKWMPYTTMISVLAAFLHFIENTKTVSRSDAIRLLKKWYWGSVLLERYSGAIESTIYRDYNDMISFITEETIPGFINELSKDLINNPNFSLIEIDRRNAQYKAIMNLLAIEGAKDFTADDSIEFYELDDHHIFPRAYLRKIKTNGKRTYEDSQINTVINKTLISSKTNRRISRKKPSDYIKNLIPPSSCDDILSSHFISKNAKKSLLQDNYQQFLKERNKSIVEKIRSLFI